MRSVVPTKDFIRIETFPSNRRKTVTGEVAEPLEEARTLEQPRKAQRQKQTDIQMTGNVIMFLPAYHLHLGKWLPQPWRSSNTALLRARYEVF
jgi:hypothetical protein